MLSQVSIAASSFTQNRARLNSTAIRSALSVQYITYVAKHRDVINNSGNKPKEQVDAHHHGSLFSFSEGATNFDDHFSNFLENAKTLSIYLINFR